MLLIFVECDFVKHGYGWGFWESQSKQTGRWLRQQHISEEVILVVDKIPVSGFLEIRWGFKHLDRFTVIKDEDTPLPLYKEIYLPVLSTQSKCISRYWGLVNLRTMRLNKDLDFAERVKLLSKLESFSFINSETWSTEKSVGHSWFPLFLHMHVHYVEGSFWGKHCELLAMTVSVRALMRGRSSEMYKSR